MNGKNKSCENKGCTQGDSLNQLYSIGDLASTFDVTTRAIRFYESKGLISPKRVGGSRAYTQGDRNRLHLILRAKRLGFTLDNIAEHLDLYDADTSQPQQLQELLNKVESSIAELNQKMDDLLRTLEELTEIHSRVQSSLRQQQL